MRVHTHQFKDNINQFGRELDSKLTYEENGNTIILGPEDLNNITPKVESALLKSVMKELNIDSNVNIPINTIINYKFGVKVRDNNVQDYRDNYDYIDYGNYIVYSSKYSADNNAYVIKAYDKMLNSMKEYTTLQSAEFPLTIREYISALCSDIGLEFENENDTFANYDKILETDPYENINYTYRDIFDDLSEVTASNFIINDNDRLEIKYILILNDTIDEEYLKDVNVNFGEKFGPVNTVILSRSEDSDKSYRTYPEDLPEENRIAITIKDNQIMNGDNRLEYLPDILLKLNGLEFYINNFTSTGIMYYEVGDMYNVSINNEIYQCIMFNDEANITQGLVEQIYTENVNTDTQEYKHMTTEEKIDRATKLMVDKVNKRVTAQAETIEIIATNIDKETGDINAVTTKEKHFTFNDEGLRISAGENDFNSLSDETGTYYYDGTTKVGEYTKDGSKQKDLSLFGAYKYGMDDINDTPMFIAQLYTNNGEEAFGHFYNRDL